MKFIKKFFKLIYALLTLMLLVVSTAAFLAPYINPYVLMIPAFLGLAFPLIWLLNAVNLLISFFVDRRIFIITLIYLLVGAPLMIRHVNLNLKRGCPENKDIYTVMSYNVKSFHGVEELDKDKTQKSIHALVNDHAPDIICFQDYSMQNKKRSSPFYRSFSEIIRQNSLQLFGYETSKVPAQCALITASKHRIIDQGIVYSPYNEIFATYSDIKLANDTLRVFNVHLESIRLVEEKTLLKPDRKQIFNRTTFEKMLSTVEKLKSAFYVRSTHALILAEAIRQSPHPVMVAGDFNDTQASFAFKTISKTLHNSSFLHTNGIKPTYVESDYPLVIDYILAGKQLNFCHYSRLSVIFSDHYPIVSNFYFRERPDK